MTVVAVGLPGDELQVALRTAIPDDEAVVMSAWLRGHRETGDWPCRVPRGRYYQEHAATLTKLLAKSTTIVACNPERPSQVLGFAVVAGPVLHWLYVKQMFRGNGIARLLWEKARRPLQCSHWTRSIAKVAGRWRLFYDPFLLLEGR